MRNAAIISEGNFEPLKLLAKYCLAAMYHSRQRRLHRWAKFHVHALSVEKRNLHVTNPYRLRPRVASSCGRVVEIRHMNEYNPILGNGRMPARGRRRHLRNYQ